MYSPFYNSRFNYHYPNNYNNMHKQPYNFKDAHKPNENKVKEIPTPKKEEQSFIDNTQIFQIFGLNLHFDDLLLIALLLFFYFEGIKDELLFISLILLLLT